MYRDRRTPVLALTSSIVTSLRRIRVLSSFLFAIDRETILERSCILHTCLHLSTTTHYYFRPWSNPSDLAERLSLRERDERVASSIVYLRIICPHVQHRLIKDWVCVRSQLTGPVSCLLHPPRPASSHLSPRLSLYLTSVHLPSLHPYLISFRPPLLCVGSSRLAFTDTDIVSGWNSPRLSSPCPFFRRYRDLNRSFLF